MDALGFDSILFSFDQFCCVRKKSKDGIKLTTGSEGMS